MDEHQLLSISALAELERVGIDFDVISDDEVKVKCPFHDDQTPSCSVNVRKNVFKCYACGSDGDLVTFLAKVLKTTRRVMWEDLSSRYALEDVKIIDASAVERWHEAVWSAKPLLKELYARGVTDEVIRARRLGYDGSRITIPVYNEAGLVVNVRRYLPGAPGKDKMRNKRGHGRGRLYPIEQLKYQTVVLCGGEIKAAVTAHYLNPNNIGAIASTIGEGNWEPEFNKSFAGKRVYVCYDVDETGKRGADSICARLKKDVSWIGRIDLPLDADKYPHGDVNDYFGQENKTAKDFLALIAATDEWQQSVQFNEFDGGEITDLHVSQASNAAYTGKRIRVNGNIAAMDTAPYVIPKRVRITCDRNQDGCSLCPVFAGTADDRGSVILDLHPESPAILEMVAAPRAAQREALISGLHLPSCKSAEFAATEYYNVEDVRLSPQLEISSRAAEEVMQPALCIGNNLEMNECYTLTGRMYPHPKNQQAVLLVSESQTSKDALSSYSPSDAALRELQAFQPTGNTLDAIREKLDAIYADMSANVTHIFERQPLHFVVDLTYHSVLLFNFDGKLTKGWVETLIAGDSSQGKSETILRMMQHYDLGERIECKNATVAGLLGGLQQMGSRWFVTWGVIPTHDKRLVVLEEIKGTSTEVIGKLTDMRSSGVAEIPKIEKRRTHARTRLIMVSNPRSDRPLSMYNFGIEAVKELIGGLEDIRRFDTVLLVSAEQIEASRLNMLQQHRPRVPHSIRSDMCRNLVLWAWTRTPEQIIITPEAHASILTESVRLCSLFTEIVPIVDRGSMRFKLARLAIALACRLFSTDDGQRVVIQPAHAQYVAQFLESTYSERVFGYKDFSDAVNMSNTLLSTEQLKKAILQAPFPSDLVKQLLYTNEIELRDICDWCGWDRNEGVQLLSLFVRKHALQRDKHSYRKSPKFIEFLKELLVSKDLESGDRPDYVKEDF